MKKNPKIPYFGYAFFSIEKQKKEVERVIPLEIDIIIQSTTQQCDVNGFNITNTPHSSPNCFELLQRSLSVGNDMRLNDFYEFLRKTVSALVRKM